MKGISTQLSIRSRLKTRHRFEDERSNRRKNRSCQNLVEDEKLIPFYFCPSSLQLYADMEKKTYRALTGLHKLRAGNLSRYRYRLLDSFSLSSSPPVFIDKLDFNRAWFHLTGRKSPTEKRFFSPHEFSRKTTSSHVASHSG